MVEWIRTCWNLIGLHPNSFILLNGNVTSATLYSKTCIDHSVIRYFQNVHMGNFGECANVVQINMHDRQTPHKFRWERSWRLKQERFTSERLSNFTTLFRSRKISSVYDSKDDKFSQKVMNSSTGDNLDLKQNNKLDVFPELIVENQSQKKKSAESLLFIGLRKAFDTIDKNFLMDKLNSSYKIADSGWVSRLWAVLANFLSSSYIINGTSKRWGNMCISFWYSW